MSERQKRRQPQSSSSPATTNSPATEVAPLLPLYAASGEWLAANLHKRPSVVLEELLARPDASRLVRTTPVQPLFGFIKTLGMEDALDLLALCAPEQVQSFVDMDGWERDRLLPTRVMPWLLALCDLGPAKLVATLKKLDDQLMTVFLGERLVIHELNRDDDPPDVPDGMSWDSPDGFYRVELRADPTEGSDSADAMRRMLESIYRGDKELGRILLQCARWDTGAETEEAAYRFRTGRMADLGYVDYYEALKIYLLLDPKKEPPPSALSQGWQASTAVHVSARPDAPLAFAIVRGLPGLSDTDSTFFRAAARLLPLEQSALVEHVLALANRMLSADRIELSDLTGAAASLGRMAGYLALGLEYRLVTKQDRSDGIPHIDVDVDEATQVLREVSLSHLFRLGYSLTVQVRKLAAMLVQGHEGALVTLAAPDYLGSLLNPGKSAALTALLALRPLYPTALENRDALDAQDTADFSDTSDEGSSSKPALPRPFARLAELRATSEFVAELATLSRLLTRGLGARKEHLIEVTQHTTPHTQHLSLVDVLGTMMANQILQRPPVFVPLSRRDLPPLAQALRAHGPGIQQSLCDHIQERVRERSAGQAEFALFWTPHSARFVAATARLLWHSVTDLIPHDLAEDSCQEALDAIVRVQGLVLRGTG